MHSDIPTIGTDEWFEESVVPNIDRIQRMDNGYYSISIALCEKRHDYYDKETKQDVKFSVFPKRVHSPHLWQPNYPHAVRFLESLKAKLESFGQRNPVVNLKFYWSGADGPGEALRQALYAPPVTGYAYFALPDNWNVTFMKYQPNEGTYKEEKSLLEHARRQRR